MYLDVNWKDGTVTHVPLSQSHTVHVISPDAKVQDAFSLDGVASLTLNLDGVPAATDPVPPVFPGAAEGATEPNAESSVSDVTTTADGGVQVSPDPTLPAETDSGMPSLSTTEATTSGDETVPLDDHAVAVDAAATTVAAAQVIAAAPEVAPADKQLQIQTALADVEQSLANWPDSAPLLDAKAQLEALAGELAQA